jgi:hypothetical protein
VSAKVTRIDSARDGRFYQVHGTPNPARADGLYPSVTHINTAFPKPALVPWAASEERKLVSAAAADLYAEQWTNECPQLPRAAYLVTLDAKVGRERGHAKALKKAGDIGTEAHKLVEWTMRRAVGAEAGPEPIVSEPARLAFMAFEDWARAVALKPILIERVVYSTRYGYAGTIDILARVCGVITEVSLKTGKQIYLEAHLQSAAYVTALAEMGYLSPQGGSLIIRLPKTLEDPIFDGNDPASVVVGKPASELLPVFLALKEVWAFQYGEDKVRGTTRTKVA